MARTKRSARGAALGLPRAKFTTIKPKKQRNKSLPKLRTDLAPPAASSSTAEDWQQLEPSLPEGSSPEVEAAVDRANQLCPVPGPPQEDVTITDLLDSLTTNPPETRAPSTLPASRSPPRSPFENGMTEDLPTDMAPSAPATVTAETVSVSASPIRAIARKLTVGAPKKHPIATKCPRPEYTKLAPSKASKPKPKEKVKDVAKNRPTHQSFLWPPSPGQSEGSCYNLVSIDSLGKLWKLYVVPQSNMDWTPSSLPTSLLAIVTGPPSSPRISAWQEE